MVTFHPKGKLLPALERNILKYRALEMAIILFEAEDLKNLIVEAVKYVKDVKSFRDPGRQKIIFEAAKNQYKRACAALVSGGILTQVESDEIRHLVNYRNDIAHRIHELTLDLNTQPYAKSYIEVCETAKYNYGARRKIEFYRDEIAERMGRKYGYLISVDSLLFDAAEKTYEQELRRLHRKIVRQLAARKAELEALHRELFSEDANAAGLYPLHKNKNGTLSDRGVQICYQLFDQGKSTLVVAHLLRISYRAAAHRRRMWDFDGETVRKAG